MPLIVPILRLCLLLLNVYETFKTLKAPPPSSRRPGHPSTRATTQRKRNMKGCLAVWIVWCCFAAYDRTFDAIVKLFVPFYDEVKAFVILFFILTRSRGAEPIYLHIIRPLVKPYTGFLDSLLDFISMAGDILVILATLPFRLALAWWHSLFARKDKVHTTGCVVTSPEARQEHEVDGSLPSSLPTSESMATYPPQPLRRLPSRDGTTRRHASDSYQPPHRPQKVPPRRQQSLHEPNLNGRAVLTHPTARGQTRSTNQLNPKSSQQPMTKPVSQSGFGPHEIWYPPNSSSGAHSDSDELLPARTGTSSVSSIEATPSVPGDTGSAGVHTTRIEIEEWRLYPPIPAAYPFTPLATKGPAYGYPSNWSDGSEPSSTVSTYPFMSTNAPPEPKQSLPPREPLKCGFNTSSSDGDGIYGYPRDHQLKTITVDPTDDSEGEDDFDVTLRTPLPPAKGTRSSSHTSNLSTAASSVRTRSTALTTGKGSSMHTRTPSESDDSMSTSDSVSISDHSTMARQIRSIPQPTTHIEIVRASRNAVSHQEMFGWIAGTGTAHKDDEYDVTSSDSVGEDSTSSSDNRQNIYGGVQQENLTSTQPKLRPGSQARRQQTTSGVNGISNNKTKFRTRDGPAVAIRKSSRLAGIGPAPPISRHVTAPVPGSSHTTVHTAPVVPRQASDRNTARQK